MNNIQRTLSIIKPDGVERNLIGKILTRFEENGLQILALKKKRLTKSEAAGFYQVHKERPFFEELVEFMSRSSVVVAVLEGEDAVAKNRKIMGATDPSKAEKGTIRADFSHSTGENTVHGSDSIENAKIEIDYFFAETELL